MAFALLIIGIFLLVSAVKGTQGDLFNLIQVDFQGQGNFVYWFVAILAIGALGYIPKLKPISVGLLTLVIAVLVLKKGDPTGIGGGLFSQLSAGLQSTTTATAAPVLVGSPGGGYFPSAPAPAQTLPAWQGPLAPGSSATIPFSQLAPITGLIQ